MRLPEDYMAWAWVERIEFENNHVMAIDAVTYTDELFITDYRSYLDARKIRNDYVCILKAYYTGDRLNLVRI